MDNKGIFETASQIINDISFSVQHGQHHNLDILTTGTTVATNGTDYIFASISAGDAPTLQFIGATDVTNTYSVGSLTADGIGSAKVYGSVDVGYRAQAEVTNGVHISNGGLDLTQEPGSVMTLDSASSINNGGTLSDQAGGAHFGAVFIVNGTLTVGANGSNNLNLSSLDAVAGTGTIRQTGTADVTSVSGSNSGLHFDIRAGELTIGSSFGHFNGTMGPSNGNGPALGPSASVSLGADFPLPIQTAKYDTSTGVLSLINSSGNDLYDVHFSGDAAGLNVGIASPYSVSITDHPGSVSPIPIAFT